MNGFLRHSFLIKRKNSKQSIAYIKLAAQGLQKESFSFKTPL
jgi:hypothetical protein